MNDVIFSKMTIKKSEIYQTIKNLLIDAGWVNLSSNPSTDYDVFNSSGVSGTKNLFFQMRSLDSSGSNDITTTDYTFCSMRFIDNYMPGANGTSGTFGRPSASWIQWPLFNSNSTISLTTSIDMYYHVNKNRLIFTLEPPIAYGTNAAPIPSLPSVHFIGLPDNALVDEIDSRGLIFAPSTNKDFTASKNIMINSPSYKSSTASITQSVYSNLSPTPINSANKTIISTIAYGDAMSEGIRGYIDGIYVLYAGGVQCYDTLSTATQTYRVYVTDQSGTGFLSTFPTKYLAIQVG